MNKKYLFLCCIVLVAFMFGYIVFNDYTDAKIKELIEKQNDYLTKYQAVELIKSVTSSAGEGQIDLLLKLLEESESNKIRAFIKANGGASGAMDAISCSDLATNDLAISLDTTLTRFIPYRYDSTTSLDEDSTSYTVIEPDDVDSNCSGNGNWIKLPDTGTVITSASNPTTLTDQQMGSVILMTAAGEVQLPDVCDSATNKWVIVMNKTATNQVEVAVQDTGDSIVLIDGTVIGPNFEADLSTDASSWAKFECLEANKWYIRSGVGVTTNGGAAD